MATRCMRAEENTETQSNQCSSIIIVKSLFSAMASDYMTAWFSDSENVNALTGQKRMKKRLRLNG